MEENKEEILDTNNEMPNKEKKSSLIGVLLTILLIVGLMIGAYYLFNMKNDKEENKGNGNEVTKSDWNGLYKKEEGTNQILLYSTDNKIATLKFAQEITAGENKEYVYFYQFDDGMTIDGNKMVREEENGSKFIIEKEGNKIVVKFEGLPILAEGYAGFVGTYNFVKDVSSTSLDELNK